MRTTRAAVLGVTALAMGILATSQARAVFIGNAQGGTDFPQGAASFADVVFDYSPVINNGEPTDLNRQADRALGVPDYESGGGCWNPSIPCTFVSLGDGGSVTLRFVDNLLTGSDSEALDLWIFEVGPDIEDTFIELSGDGSKWHSVGKVYGSTAGIDIDAFGFGASRSFSFIRLTDDPIEDDQIGMSVGADIDAVGAISTRIVPEPAGVVLFAIGVVLLLRSRLGRVSVIVALSAVASTLAMQVQADEFRWLNPTTDGQFANPLNWNPSDQVPASLDTAIFDQRLGNPDDAINGVGVLQGTAIDRMKLTGTAIVDLSIGDGSTANTFYITNPTESLVVGENSLDAAFLNLLVGKLDAQQVRIGGGSVLDVAGTGVLAAHGTIQAFGTLAVRGIPTGHASTLDEPPPTCTNGDCSPPPTCTNGDCTPPPICTNGDCSPPPVCTNGDCSTVPETENVLAQNISVAGELLLDGGHIAMPLDGGLLEIVESGRLAGSGRIGGDAINAGLIDPGLSVGWILIDGDLTQISTGRLVLEIASHSQFDRLVVRGIADLGGALEIVLRDGYLPGRRNVFPLIDAHDPDFHFDEILVTGGPLELRFTPQGLFAVGVPEPASLGLVMIVAIVGSCLRTSQSKSDRLRSKGGVS